MFKCILRNRSRVVGSLAFLVGLALVLNSSLAIAQKKPGGGGGGGVEGGTIYFDVSFVAGGVSAMDSSGANKVQLPDNVWGDPSRLRHGGRRWFLQGRRIEGETYSNGTSKRYEVFAVRDDGNEAWTVQLTNDPTLQLWSVRWAPGETENSAFISGMARRWNADGTVDPDSVGVYLASVGFDSGGNVLVGDPPAFAVSLGVIPGSTAGSWFPDAYVSWFDWSPDLREVVYTTSDRAEVKSVDVLTGEFRVLTTGGLPGGPFWSPAGNLIAFNNGSGSIETIAANGSNRKVIIRADNRGYYSAPTWSPAGGYLIYSRISGTTAADIYRATSSGGSKTNLTGDISDPVSPVAWR